MQTVAHAGEELLQFAHPQGVEHDVLASGEQAIQRGARHAGFGGDVVDGQLAQSPAIDATARGIENSIFGAHDRDHR